jgi:preprotein translocase subunit SecY
MKIVDSFQNIFRIPELRKRIFFTLGMLVVFRLGSHIALPGINPLAIEGFQEGMKDSLRSLFHYLQIFGSFGNLALFGLGIMPYITASIIMQLMTKVSPALEAIAKEGPSGQRKIGQYTRYLAVPICIVQAWMAVNQLKAMSATSPIFTSTGFGMTLQMIIALTAGAMFVMWLGEQITEYGLGNGASILIMAGIIARMPQIWYDLFIQAGKDSSVVSVDKIVLMALLFVAAIAATVLITQAQRRIPIQHAKHFKGRRVMQGQRNYLPLRVNTAGVMPVIFASSLLVIPSVLALIPGLKFMANIVTPGGFLYMIFYIAMIFIFSYFWTYLFFQPHELANNLKEYGSFVPGIRPGENTAAYLNGILARITLAGAAFLCIIALLPDMTAKALGMDTYFLAFLGGTGILIVVGVCLDIAQKIESHLLMHHYEGFVGGGGSIRGRRG